MPDSEARLKSEILSRLRERVGAAYMREHERFIAEQWRWCRQLGFTAKEKTPEDRPRG